MKDSKLLWDVYRKESERLKAETKPSDDDINDLQAVRRLIDVIESRNALAAKALKG